MIIIPAEFGNRSRQSNVSGYSVLDGVGPLVFNPAGVSKTGGKKTNLGLIELYFMALDHAQRDFKLRRSKRPGA